MPSREFRCGARGWGPRGSSWRSSWRASRLVPAHARQAGPGVRAPGCREHRCREGDRALRIFLARCCTGPIVPGCGRCGELGEPLGLRDGFTPTPIEGSGAPAKFMFGRADEGSFGRDPASHGITNEMEDVSSSVPKSVEPAVPTAELVRCFLRLASLPNYALDRLSQYEETLWRQMRQILFALDALDRRKPQDRGRRFRFGSRQGLPIYRSEQR